LTESLYLKMSTRDPKTSGIDDDTTSLVIKLLEDAGLAEAAEEVRSKGQELLLDKLDDELSTNMATEEEDEGKQEEEEDSEFEEYDDDVEQKRELFILRSMESGGARWETPSRCFTTRVTTRAATKTWQ